VLLMSLIVLVVLLISAVALVRSFDTSLFQSGNVAFKRDLVNQGERVVPTVMQAFTSGALSTPTARANHLQTSNYRATILPSNAQGVPLALLGDDAAFSAVADTGNNIVVSGQAVTVRYVVDRMCSATGLDAALGPASCTFAEVGAPVGGTSYAWERAELAGANGAAGAQPRQVIYRISIRVDGPRKTQAFLQTTFTM
jgi:hypothetical protein